MEPTEIAIVTSRPDLMARLTSRLRIVPTRRGHRWSLFELLGASREVLKLAIVDVLALLDPFQLPLPPIPRAPVPMIFAGHCSDVDGFVAAYSAGIQAYPLDMLEPEALGGPLSEASLVPIHQRIGPLQTRRIRTFLIGRLAKGALPPHEAAVFELVQRGYSNQQIATELSLAEQTVKNKVSSSFRKLGISSRIEAVAAGAVQMPCECCLFAANDPEPLAFLDRSRRTPA